MAASHRLEEDLIEWRGLSELLVFPLRDIELIGFDFAASEQTNSATQRTGQRKNDTFRSARQKKACARKAKSTIKRKGCVRGSGVFPRSTRTPLKSHGGERVAFPLSNGDGEGSRSTSAATFSSTLISAQNPQIDKAQI